MSRYRPKPLRHILHKFWTRKLQNILQKRTSTGASWPMSLDRYEALLSDFSEKFPGQVSVCREVSDDQTEGRKNFMLVPVRNFSVTVKFEKWLGDKIGLTFDPIAATAKLRLASAAGLENDFVEVVTCDFGIDLGLTLKKLEDLVKNYPKYRTQAEGKQNQKDKAEKLEEMGRRSIETIVPQMMKGSGYEWSLMYNDIHYVLFVKMKKRKMLQITMTPKNFAGKIANLLNVISQMDRLLGEIPYAVDVKTCGSNIKWRKD